MNSQSNQPMVTDAIQVSDGRLAKGMFRIILFKEGDYFVAQIPTLNLSSHSKVEDKAVKGIDEALDLFFKIYKNEKLREKLTDLGWIKGVKSLSPSSELVRLPLDIIANGVTPKFSQANIDIPVYANA